MANVLGLAGLNRLDGTTKLIAAYGNDLINVDTGAGYSQNITSTNSPSFEQFLNHLFYNNYADKPRHFNGTIWGTNLASKMPMAKYMKRWRNKLYLGYVKFPQSGVESWDADPIGSGASASDITFGSRVFACELPTEKNKIKWGVHWSSKYSTLKDADNKLRLSSYVGPGFLDVGIKFGDPVYILDGASLSLGKYTVARVDSNDQITTLETIPKQLTNATGWIGSNWFEVDTEDGDFLTGLEENNDRLLVFKQDKLYRYDATSLKPVKGCPGTTSPASIKNVKDTYTIYFHGSSGNKTGFYLYDGVSSKKISNALEKHILGIPSTSYSSIVAWTEGDLYRAYIGTITNSNFGISLTQAVWTYDITTNTQSIDPIGKTITCSGQVRESGGQNTYIGDSDNSVFLVGQDTAYDYDGGPINFEVITHPRYPLGSDSLAHYTRCQVIARNARGMKIEYKLIDDQSGKVDDRWYPLGEVEDDKTEFTFPIEHRIASGIQYRAAQSSTKEPDMLLEKITTFYRSEGTYHVVPRQ